MYTPVHVVQVNKNVGACEQNTRTKTHTHTRTKIHTRTHAHRGTEMMHKEITKEKYEEKTLVSHISRIRNTGKMMTILINHSGIMFLLSPGDS